jgi:hypothetical protein
MPTRRNDEISTSCIVEDNENMAGTTAVKPNSPINTMKKPENKPPERLHMHGQPGQYGRRHPLNRK